MLAPEVLQSMLINMSQHAVSSKYARQHESAYIPVSSHSKVTLAAYLADNCAHAYLPR